MKNKRIVISLLIFSFVFLGINGVKAETECNVEDREAIFDDYLTYKKKEDGTLFLIRNYKDKNTVVLADNKFKCSGTSKYASPSKRTGKTAHERREEEQRNSCDDGLDDKLIKFKIEWSEGNTEIADIYKIRGGANEIQSNLDWSYMSWSSFSFKDTYNYFLKIKTSNGTAYAISNKNPSKINFDKLLNDYCDSAGNFERYTLIGTVQSIYSKNIAMASDTGTTDLTGELPKQKYKSFYDEEDNTYYKCGDLTRISKGVPKFTNLLYRLIKVIVPIILVVMGTSDFLRAVSANDEKSMDETPKRFARRIGAAVLIYFVMTMVQLVIKVIDTDNKSSVLSCAKCFISSEEKCETYNYSFGQADEGTGSEAKSSKEGGGSDAGGETEGGGFR